MGKGTDKLYITHSEWASEDAFSASAGSKAAKSSSSADGLPRKKLPFYYCAASLQPFKNAVCTAEGTIFDRDVIQKWLEKNETNPATGELLQSTDLVQLHFTRLDDHEGDRPTGQTNPNSSADPVFAATVPTDYIDPITHKVFTEHTHIVAIRHGDYANVFAYETVQRMNIKQALWQDLLDDEPFTRKDIITLQDPLNITSPPSAPTTGAATDKISRAKAAVEKSRRERAGVADDSTALVTKKDTELVSKTNPKSLPKASDAKNAAVYTTGRAAASFTSTGLTPETSGERALLSDEDYLLKPKRVKIKGYARLETNYGDLHLELHTDTAPRAVWNFIRLAQKGYYKGVIFHRNIPNFMIQGGDPTGTGRGGSSIWGRDFSDEFDGPHRHSERGVLSMANKGKNTNSSQFFITYGACSHLDLKHTVFGRVIEPASATESNAKSSKKVLDTLEDIPTDGSDRPLNRITIKDIVVYLDPFEEFQKLEPKNPAATRQLTSSTSSISSSGSTNGRSSTSASSAATSIEDQQITWTGKRVRDVNGNTIRNKANEGGGSNGAGIGKYLQAALNNGASDRTEKVDDAFPVIEERAPKKAKVAPKSGFGNFDNW